ncbi:MAG: NADH-quinone oxidoreductase subunit L [Thermodesulfobacteriota bacterium]
MLAIIVLTPLLGAVINGLFYAAGLGKKLSLKPDNKEAVTYISCGAVLISALLSTYLFISFIKTDPESRLIVSELFTWIPSGELNVKFELLFDTLSAVMALVVTWVGFLIHVYSIGYMHHDKSYARYFTYLNLFIFFMLMLILGNNFLMMFIGWEGVGLASYLLIGFWYEDSLKAYAGRKAFVVNRIGDFGFILGIFLIFTVFGSLNYQEVFSKLADPVFVSGVSVTVITAIALLLFVGAVGKSAQFPLYVWLPDAMAGPTAVSALIHAATMVTAGVYMVSRCSLIFNLSPLALNVVLAVAAFTAFFAATIALTQNDIKKVLAYSTVSQLGYMFMAAGVGAYFFAIFHVVTHAFFKALLFLGSGSVIHAMSDDQDIRNMGGLRKMIPITAVTFLIGTLAISGFPLLSGFFSKDEILASVYSSGHTFFWIIGCITAVLTAYYMTRLYILTFEGEPRMSREVKQNIHESPRTMTVPLLILAVLSVLGGLLGVPHFMSEGIGLSYFPNLIEEFLSSSVYVLPYNADHFVGFHLGHWSLVLISIAAAFLGIFIAVIQYIVIPNAVSKKVEKGNIIKGIYKGSVNKWYVDEIYNSIFVEPFNDFSKQFSNFDKSVVDGALDGLSDSVKNLSKRISSFQSGLTRYYAAIMVCGVILIIAVLVF